MNATFVLVRSHSPIIFSAPFTPPPPNRSVLRVCSGVQAALRQGAPRRPLGREPSSPSRHLSDVKNIGRNVRHVDLLNNARGNSANPPKRAEKRRGKKSRVSHLGQVLKKDASRRSEETGDGASAAGVTLGQRLFPPHRDAHPPPPNLWSYYSSYYHYDSDFTTTISPHPLPDKAVCAL